MCVCMSHAYADHSWYVMGQRYFNSNMTIYDNRGEQGVLFASCGTVPSCFVLCSLVHACNALQFKPLQSRYGTIVWIDLFDSKQAWHRSMENSTWRHLASV